MGENIIRVSYHTDPMCNLVPSPELVPSKGLRSVDFRYGFLYNSGNPRGNLSCQYHSLCS